MPDDQTPLSFSTAGVSHLGPGAVDRVASIITMSYAFGEVSGPVLGGLAYDAVGFAWECCAVSAVTAGYGVFLAVLLALRLVEKTGVGEEDVDDEERRPLRGAAH